MKKTSIIFAVIAIALLTFSVKSEAAQGDTIYVFATEETYMLKQFQGSKMVYHQYFSVKEWCYAEGHHWAQSGAKRTFSCEKIK